MAAANAFSAPAEPSQPTITGPSASAACSVDNIGCGTTTMGLAQ